MRTLIDGVKRPFIYCLLFVITAHYSFACNKKESVCSQRNTENALLMSAALAQEAFSCVLLYQTFFAQGVQIESLRVHKFLIAAGICSGALSVACQRIQPYITYLNQGQDVLHVRDLARRGSIMLSGLSALTTAVGVAPYCSPRTLVWVESLGGVSASMISWYTAYRTLRSVVFRDTGSEEYFAPKRVQEF